MILFHSVLLLALTADAPLIQREVLFARADRLAPKLSPDGKRVAWLGRDSKNAALLQVWARQLDTPGDVELTQDHAHGITEFEFAADSIGVLATQTFDAEGNTHIVYVDLSTFSARDLTPKPGIRAQLLCATSRLPDTVLVASNQRDKKSLDVWRINLKTGAADLDTVNPGDVRSWLIDPAYAVRGAIATTPEGGTEVRIRESNKAPWKPFITTGPEETLQIYDFTADNRSLLMSTTISGDTARIVEKNLKSGTERVLAQHEKSDPLNVLLNSNKHSIQAVSFTDGGHEEWRSLDYSVTADLEALKKTGEATVVSSDTAEQKWLVALNQDIAPTRFSVLERKSKVSTPLFAPPKDAPSYLPTTPVSFAARDGQVLNGYYTAPNEVKRLPLVMLVHDGPWSFDTWRFDPLVQFLVNRGYAVLQVNFRGSTGSGKRFAQAGHRQWGGVMNDDLLDGVKWAIDQFTIDPKRVAIMGEGTGGLAALLALESAPDTFACGVDSFGPLTVATMLASSSMKPVLLRRLGNPADPADKEVLARVAPIANADKIKVPVLIFAGENDPRVKANEIDQLLANMSKSATVITYLNERERLTRFENTLDFHGRLEAFFAQCLGGRAEPMPRAAGATAVVKTKK